METKKLIDCCEFISDGDHLPPPKSDSGVPFITISNITGQNKLSFEDTMFVPESYYNGLNENKKAKKGDILYSVVGSFGKPVYVDFDKQMVFQRHIAILRPKRNVNARFIYYTMLNPQFYKLVDKLAIGCSQRTVTLDTLRNIEISLPDKDIQDKTVEVLSLIDRKIDENCKINDNLEQQIKTIFTFQFLQNANTEWKQQSLAELSEMYQPKTISGKDLIADGNYFVYGANGIIGKYNQYNHSESEIAVACRGASCGSIQMTLPFSWITGNAMVVKPHSDFPYREYLYYYLLAKNPNYLCSGSAQPQLTRENLTLYSLKVPSTTELNAFESYAEKVRKIIIKNQQENIELSTLRAWLLPMLMNGQAIISD